MQEYVKKFLGSGHNATLVISNDDMKDDAKKQKSVFFSMLLGKLSASLLGNMLAGKGFIRAGEGATKVGYGSKGSSIKRSLLKKN